MLGVDLSHTLPPSIHTRSRAPFVLLVQALNQLPMHVKNWQLMERCCWLQRVDNLDVIPVVGGDGAFFVNNFAHRRTDTSAFLSNRLNEFISKGWLWSNTEKVVNLSKLTGRS